VAASCWGNKPIPMVVQSSSLTDYSIIANGPFHTVFADNLTHEEAGRRLVDGVSETLNKFW
jgi:hypothetical protein